MENGHHSIALEQGFGAINGVGAKHGNAFLLGLCAGFRRCAEQEHEQSRGGNAFEFRYGGCGMHLCKYTSDIVPQMELQAARLKLEPIGQKKTALGQFFYVIVKIVIV